MSHRHWTAVANTDTGMNMDVCASIFHDNVNPISNPSNSITAIPLLIALHLHTITGVFYMMHYRHYGLFRMFYALHPVRDV